MSERPTPADAGTAVGTGPDATAEPAAATRGGGPKAYQVWHVGRRGEVAGGMTQVLNGYLRWQFDRVEVGVIVSRDGSTGARALAVFARALTRVARLGDRPRTVVVVHLSQGGSFVREGLLLRLARARGFATVAHLHGSSFVDFAVHEPARVGAVLRAADRVLVLSTETAAAAARFVPAERVFRVPNAVYPGRPAAKSKHVVFGGSVSRRKGVDVLVEAWRRVSGPDGTEGWTLDVVGPVADADVVPAELPHAVFHGPLPHEELMALLDRAEIAVLPSRDEALPMFLLEALARGACAVSTSVGGIPTALGGGAGLVVPPGDPGALAEALAAVMGSDELRASVVAAGSRRFTERYSAEAGYPRLEQLWVETLTSRS